MLQRQDTMQGEPVGVTLIGEIERIEEELAHILTMLKDGADTPPPPKRPDGPLVRTAAIMARLLDDTNRLQAIGVGMLDAKLKLRDMLERLEEQL